MEARTPEKIMQLGWAFWGSKALLSAVELGLFTELAIKRWMKEAGFKRAAVEALAGPDSMVVSIK